MSTQILAIDTTTEACSVALLHHNEIISQYKECSREHAQQILPMVEQVLALGGTQLNKLDALALSCGPGSFTGVRIGFGIAQGLALGADLPVLPISTLKVLAQGAFRLTRSRQVIAAIDARMGELYWAKYQLSDDQRWSLIDCEQVISPQAAAEQLTLLSDPWCYVGSGWQSYPQLVTDNLTHGLIILPQAQDILPLALNEFKAGKTYSVEEIEPSYLRNEVTWKKLPGR